MWLTVVLICLATHRVTRFALRDRMAAGVRDRIQLRAEVRWARKDVEARTAQMADGKWHSPIAYLLTCPWCFSIWVGAACTAVTLIWVDVPLPLFVWLASSSVTALMFGLEGDEE